MNNFTTKSLFFFLITFCITVVYNPSYSNNLNLNAFEKSKACEIFNLTAIPQPCTPNGVFFVVIDFEIAGDYSAGFSVHGNGNDYGTFEYGDLPVQVGPLEGNGTTEYEFVVNDLEDLCSNFTVIDPVSCDIQGNCEIGAINFEPGCDGNVSYGFINFDHANTSDSFHLTINNDSYIFAYSDLPVNISPLPDNGNTYMLVTVTDQENPNCINEVDHEAIDCSAAACEIWDLVVDPLDCNNDGTYDIVINFNYENPGNDFFDLIDANGNNLGFYALSELPVTHPNFVPSGNNHDVVTVCINDNPNCCATLEFEAPDCTGGDCHIFEMVAEAYDCDGEFFLVDIDFQYENTSDSFTVVGNGNNYGTFAYNDLYITLGPFEGNGQTLEFIVFDQNQESCNQEVILEAPNCGGGDCEIWDLVVDPLDCNNDGTYDIVINFNYSNPGNDFFDLIDANGNNLGFYALSELPVTHPNFVPSGNNHDVVTVCINDNPNCCATVEFEAPDCTGGDCHIFEMIAEAYDCDGEFFLVDIDFQYENTSDSFTVVGNGNNYGTFAYNDLYITLGPFEGNGQILEFIVFDQNQESCNAEIGLEAPNCNNNSCEIGAINFEPGCDGDISFGFINFDHANTSDSFHLTINNDSYIFAYSDLPVNISPLPDNGNTYMLVTVTDQENPNCINEVDHEAIDCSAAACEIWDLVVDPLDCNNDGTYDIVINFNYENPGNDFFDLIDANGNNLGYYALSELPVTHPNFVPSGNNHDVVTVCINDNPNCCATVEFEAPDCTGGDCHIFEMVAEAYDCDGEFFLVDIDFQYENTSDSFTVVGNGNNYGTFAYNDLYITLGPFEGNGQVLEFIVFDQNQESCNQEVVLEAPNCGGGDCEIWDLVVDPLDCNNDGTYDIVINFNYENPGNDFFDLIDANGNNLGYYALAELPVTHPNFVPSGNNHDVVTVCINDNPNCCATLEFEAPDCTGGDCHIFEMIAEAYDCDGEFFLVDIDFQYENTSDSFTVVGNGNNYGTFAYNDLYITLGPFEGNGQTLEFIVFDQNQESCNQEVVLEAPNCGGGDCEIWDLVVDPLDCNNDGTYDIVINFNYENPGNDFFDLIDANGNNLGYYALAELPVTHPNFVPSGNNHDVVTVCINDNPNCCATLEFEALDCTGGDCHIFEMVAEAYDCDGEFFLVDIDFQYENTSDSFTVVGNGNNYGTFAYNDLYITLGPFEGNGQILEFIVFDQNQESCNQEVILEAPNCGGGDCDITELVVDPLECNDDGTYSIAINFQYDNPGNDFFDLFGTNGEFIGFFNLNELPLVIQHFQPSGNDHDVVTVCINDNPNCCATVEFEALECEEACHIDHLEAEAFCDGDDLYVEFSFDYSGVGDSFNLLSCTGLGTFAYGQSSYTIQIPNDLVDCAGGIIIPLGVFDQDDQFCGDAILVEIPDCYNTGCIIGDIEAEISDCENGQFFVTLDFDYQEVSNEGFQVFGNGNNYGEFDYGDLPVTLGPFEANGQDMEFIVMDIVDEACWNFTELEAPVCFAAAEHCIEFESLYNGVNYGGSNSTIGDLLLIEDGVYVTIEGVDDPLGNNNYDYLFATNQDICSPFEAANGIRMFMFNGLRFDFSQLPENPGVVIFNYHNCGLPFAVSVNDQTPVTYVFPETDQTFNLTPTVTIHFDVDEDNPERGTATLEGDIASLFVGGVELQVDNVCFNVEQELTDVWPGDANYDNTANHFDLLNIGLTYGFEGTDRDDINIDWFAMPSDDWVGQFINEANHKHADTNGDGKVNAEDRGAILENYGLEHGDVPIFLPVEGTENDPALFVDLPEAQDIIIGQPFEAPIVLGTQSIPVEDIYGLAFTVVFDTEMMDETQVFIELGDSWMGENGQNLITLNKSMASEGKFEVAITRTNHNNVSGQGSIGHFIGIIDDILGKQEVEVQIIGVKAINNNEAPVPLRTPVEVVDLATSIDIRLIEKDLEVFPNPTDETLYILNSGTHPTLNIKLYNTLGQLMTEIQNPEALQRVDVSEWPAGMYFVTIEIGDSVITKKVKVTNL